MIYRLIDIFCKAIFRSFHALISIKLMVIKIILDLSILFKIASKLFSSNEIKLNQNNCGKCTIIIIIKRV